MWQQHQSLRSVSKLNMKFPKPRHEIARFLEEITMPTIVKEIPDKTLACFTYKNYAAKNLKFSTEYVIVATPVSKPITKPILLILAAAVLTADQIPPIVVSLNSK